MIKQVSRRRTDEREQVSVSRAPRPTCECCGAAIRRQSFFSNLYHMLCRACWTQETAQLQQEVE